MPDILAIDTETTGLASTDRAFGVSWQLTGHPARYIDMRLDGPGEFLQVVNSTTCRIVAHNTAYDYKMLHNAGIEIDINRLDCTVVRAAQINEHEVSYSLDSLAKKYLGRAKRSELYEEMAHLLGGPATREAQMPRIAHAPAEMVSRYAIPDAELCHDLWQWQEAEIKRQGIEDICAFERSITPAIIRNMMRGIRVDVDAAERAVQGLTKIIDADTMKMFKLAGKTFNINSPPDMAKIFKPHQSLDGRWRTSDGHVVPSTPGGKPSFSAEALRDIGSPLSEMILETRSMMKTRDTFLMGHVLGNQVDGRVYPQINQTKGEDGGTGTGRFSYTNPAMQQIPSRNKAVACIVKPIFLPDEGQVWVDSDMHSFEVRVFAHLVNNPRIITAYQENPLLDFHQFVADLTGLPRNAKFSGQANAKQLNLSMIFNSGNGAIADKMGMGYTMASFKRGMEVFVYKKAGPEAEAVIAQYHEAVPGVKQLAERAKKKAEAFGYISTHFGRRIRFPKGYKTYAASGLAIQATAADLNKRNWLLIEEALGSEGRLILNTHDSYGMSMPENWEPHWKRVKEIVEQGNPWFRVPIILDHSGVGKNWWEAING